MKKKTEPAVAEPTSGTKPMEVYRAGEYEHAVSIWIPDLEMNVSVHNVEPAPFTGEPEVAIFIEGDLSKVRVIDSWGATWTVGPKEEGSGG